MIWTIVQHNPIAGLTFLCCLYTLYRCTRLVGRMRWWEDRYMIGFIGLVSIQQSLKVLRDVGVFELSNPPVERAVDLIVALLFLLALVVAGTQASDHNQTRLRLRLLESNLRFGKHAGEASPPPPPEKLALASQRATRRSFWGHRAGGNAPQSAPPA
jgi:hypothetical protein